MFHVISTGARANKNCRVAGTAADATLEFSPLLRGQSQESRLDGSMVFDFSQENERVRINICGQLFETSTSNIKRYPKTLLGNPEKNSSHFDATRNEFFFDRNREAFDCIFFFYQSGGKLLKPQNMSAEEFLDELTFFQMGSDVIDKYIDTYCPNLKKPHRLNESSTDDYSDRDLTVSSASLTLNLRKVKGVKQRVWEIFDRPEMSAASRTIAGISVSMIILSVIVLCVESEHYFITVPVNASVESSNVTAVPQKEIIPLKRRRTDENLYSLFIIESLAMTWFTAEFAVRFLSCPSKLDFLKSVLNIFDFLAVLPFYSTLLMEYGALAQLNNVKARPLSMLRITRLVRIFPILKLTRHSKNLQILGHTFRSSLNELGLLIFFFSMSVVLFSSAVYIAEQDYKPKDRSLNEFSSIPAGFWWAVITMSTVGYGDMIPQTVLGKVVGSACALVGILTLSLPVPIIVSNFTYYYQEESSSSSCQTGTSGGDADLGNIAATIQRYSMMGPTVANRSKKTSTMSIRANATSSSFA